MVLGAAAGAIGGAFLGDIVAPAFGKGLPSGAAGKIGELLSWIGIRPITIGQIIRNPKNGFGKSTFDYKLPGGQYIEAKTGNAKPSSDNQADAIEHYLSLGQLQYHQWTWPKIGGLPSSGIGAAAASGCGC